MARRTKDKYWLWSVQPQGGSALLMVCLGRKKDIQRRWHELTKNGEKDMPLLFWQMFKRHCKHVKLIKYEVHKTFEWKPDALVYMRELALQNKYLLVEDLS